MTPKASYERIYGKREKELLLLVHEQKEREVRVKGVESKHEQFAHKAGNVFQNTHLTVLFQRTSVKKVIVTQKNLLV
jgi:hypothetical protein